jgi:hypothetical protein
VRRRRIAPGCSLAAGTPCGFSYHAYLTGASWAPLTWWNRERAINPADTFSGPRLGRRSREIECMHARRNRDDRAKRRGQIGAAGVAQPRRPNGAAGNAHRNYERYIALAREAMLRGDSIEAENCYQHAEHYFRVMRGQ